MPTKNPEITPSPSLPIYTFDGTPGEAETELLASFDVGLQHDPEQLLSAFNVYFANPEATGRIVNFLNTHKEGLAQLELWQKLWESKVDKQFEFDPETTLLITKDPEIKAALKDIGEGGAIAEAASDQIRARRLRLFVGRRATAHRIRLKAAQAGSADSTNTTAA